MTKRAIYAPIYKPVPSFLRELREGAGITIRELGDRLGKPHSWVHKGEQGLRRIDVAEFYLWCKHCGVDPVKGFRSLASQIEE